MFADAKGFADAIAKKAGKAQDVEQDGPDEEGDEKEAAPEGMKAAVENIMAALGQDYGSGPNESKGQRQAFEDKRDRLCTALCAFFDLYDAGE